MKVATKLKGTRRRVRVGARVKFRLGIGVLSGVIVEDMGKLAPGGKHLYRIKIKSDPDFFMPATAERLRVLGAKIS